MKFKITGDNLLEIDRLLERFCKETEKEYEVQIAKAKAKLKGVPFVSHSADVLPDVMAMIHIQEKTHVILRSSLVVPKLTRKMIVKKMTDNLKGYLEKSGCKNVKIEYMGD